MGNSKLSSYSDSLKLIKQRRKAALIDAGVPKRFWGGLAD